LQPYCSTSIGGVIGGFAFNLALAMIALVLYFGCVHVDRINEDGKKAIVRLLNKSIEVEYAFIFNYPRLIDQLVNIQPIT